MDTLGFTILQVFNNMKIGNWPDGRVKRSPMIILFKGDSSVIRHYMKPGWIFADYDLSENLFILIEEPVDTPDEDVNQQGPGSAAVSSLPILYRCDPSEIRDRVPDGWTYSEMPSRPGHYLLRPRLENAPRESTHGQETKQETNAKPEEERKTDGQSDAKKSVDNGNKDGGNSSPSKPCHNSGP